MPYYHSGWGSSSGPRKNARQASPLLTKDKESRRPLLPFPTQDLVLQPLHP